MKKIKINIDRTPVSKEEIDSKRNFENVLKQVMSYTKPFYKTQLFLNSIVITLFTVVVAYTVGKLETHEQDLKLHENDGYAEISSVKEIGSRDSLKTQSYVIHIHKDERIQTDQGAIILIPANALQSKDSSVELLVKEAYTMEDMIRGGLTTKTGRELLSSGGMFYIQAKDSANVKITKPISISVPTDEVDSNMKLFKGETTPLGKIDWQDPVALKKDTAKVVSEGETLFKENCKSCHTLGKESVGPDLAYIGKRRDIDWIKRYIKNSASVISGACSDYNGLVLVDSNAKGMFYIVDEIDHSNDKYAACLYNAYNKSVMTAFPALDDNDIKSLCEYLNEESKRLKLPYPKDELYINFQKCKTYKALMSKLNKQKSTLKNNRENQESDNGAFLKDVNISMQVLGLRSNATVIRNVERNSLIYPKNKQNEYYQVEINTFGWFNIDMLTKNLPGLVSSNLIVHVNESLINTFQIYLVLPDMKVHAPGGLLKDKKDVYGFYEDNGNIMLPQGKTAHVYLVGEKNGQLIYAATTFLTDTLNNLTLNPTIISKELFNVKIKELLGVKGISVKAAHSKNAIALRQIDTDLNALDEQIKEAEKSKPANCDCGCDVHEEVVSDSTQVTQTQSIQTISDWEEGSILGNIKNPAK